jgi:SAM-dependent methyltransferase
MERWRADNHALWQEMATLHPTSDLYDVDGLVAGRDDLRPWEPSELGPVEGMDLLHLQCHIGTDTIGWARRGARVTGLDFSSNALAAAADLAQRLGIEARWVESDVHDAVSALGGRTFDVVYTGIGALVWLPDIAEWARIARQLVRPGGRLYVVEIHPMWQAMVEDGERLCQPAIHAPFTLWEEEGAESYAAPGVPLSATASHQRLHGLGDILTAVLEAGFTIEQFHEQDVTPAPSPWMERRDDGLFHFREGAFRFPVCFSLLARAPASGAASTAEDPGRWRGGSTGDVGGT